MKAVTEKAYAKLNLSLTVGGTLPNGYHALESVMQSISLHDALRIEKSDGIRLVCDKPFIPTDERNLAYKAAELFFRESDIKGGAAISITKRIPVCAGLGGGSTDAAATLRGLNRLYGTPFSMAELTAMSASLGADVPFCIRGGTVYATGVGDVLEPLPHLPMFYLLIYDKTPLSTPKMYKALDEGKACFSDSAAVRRAVMDGDGREAARLAANSFLTVATEACPIIEANITALLETGAITATVTGKGPTVFGVFESKAAALLASKKIKGTFAESVRGAE